MKSIYVAGPFDTQAKISLIARQLMDQYNVVWFDGFDWTRSKKEDLPVRAKQWADLEIKSSQLATLFVARLDPLHTMRGTWCEIGARLASGKVAHVLLNGVDPYQCVFLHHPGVRLYLTDMQFWTTWDRAEFTEPPGLRCEP